MKTKRILIIDDEVDFTYLLKRFFERKQCSVDIAHNLAEGIKKLDNTEPYYILLDNNLPDGLGWEKANHIVSKHPNSKLLLMSGAVTQLSNGEAYTILEKPFSLNELDKIMFSNRA